jgi:hypothetical protein
MFAQLPTPSPTSTQTWAAAITAVAGAVALVLKKRLNRTRTPAPPKADLITRTEFHQGLDTLRDKLDANHKELLSALLNQGTIIEKRLDVLDASIARLDERTKRP